MSRSTEVVDQFVIKLNSEQAMTDFGGKLSAIISELAVPMLILLSGDLGAGKTTLSRGILQGLGHRGAVKSPTYTLVEPYDLALGTVYHFDLYRLVDAEELEHIGFADYLLEAQLCMIEWPENGEGFIPVPDIVIKIAPSAIGRCVTLVAASQCGKVFLKKLNSR